MDAWLLSGRILHLWICVTLNDKKQVTESAVPDLLSKDGPLVILHAFIY